MKTTGAWLLKTPARARGANFARNRLLSAIAFESLSKYLRLSVTGEKNIPRNGPVVFISNHSGFAGTDALLLRYLLYKSTKAIPKILIHKLWYVMGSTGQIADKLGFIEAKFKNGVSSLKEGHSILLFPEGAHGNFKPYSEKYRLQDFKAGFLKMALECGCPISPVVILGPEESHINLKKIDLGNVFKDAALPVPLNVWPLPVKWRVHFLEAIQVSENLRNETDREVIRGEALKIQKKLQGTIDQLIAERGHPYI